MSAIARADVPVAGGTLAAFTLGPVQAGDAVVAVHGITASSHTWVRIAREVPGDVTIIAPDLRGRGRSNGLPGPYGLDSHVRDLLAVLDHFGLQQPVLVGHSLGAYIVARLAAEHPNRARSVVLVDGGLTIPGTENVDPQAFADAFLGPALARLKLTFHDREEYRAWWRRHPALADKDIAAEDLNAYADHDLDGHEPQMRSAVAEAAVRGDAGDLVGAGTAAERLEVPATLLCAPRGLLDEPHPMQPLEVVRDWAAQAPERRRFTPVPDVNHYTIVLGAAGARAVAGAIAAAAHAAA